MSGPAFLWGVRRQSPQGWGGDTGPEGLRGSRWWACRAQGLRLAPGGLGRWQGAESRVPCQATPVSPASRGRNLPEVSGGVGRCDQEAGGRHAGERS